MRGSAAAWQAGCVCRAAAGEEEECHQKQCPQSAPQRLARRTGPVTSSHPSSVPAAAAAGRRAELQRHRVAPIQAVPHPYKPSRQVPHVGPTPPLRCCCSIPALSAAAHTSGTVPTSFAIASVICAGSGSCFSRGKTKERSGVGSTARRLLPFPPPHPHRQAANPDGGQAAKNTTTAPAAEGGRGRGPVSTAARRRERRREPVLLGEHLPNPLVHLPPVAACGPVRGHHPADTRTPSPPAASRGGKRGRGGISPKEYRRAP